MLSSLSAKIHSSGLYFLLYKTVQSKQHKESTDGTTFVQPSSKFIGNKDGL
jgi:hypothetical protein